jgi:hypothetical protein
MNLKEVTEDLERKERERWLKKLVLYVSEQVPELKFHKEPEDPLRTKYVGRIEEGEHIRIKFAGDPYSAELTKPIVVEVFIQHDYQINGIKPVYCIDHRQPLETSILYIESGLPTAIAYSDRSGGVTPAAARRTLQINRLLKERFVKNLPLEWKRIEATTSFGIFLTPTTHLG